MSHLELNTYPQTQCTFCVPGLVSSTGIHVVIQVRDTAALCDALLPCPH